MNRRDVRTGGAALVLLLSLSACGSDDTAPDISTDEPKDLTVTSPAFGEGDPVPERFTCDGDDVSPPLAWTGAPSTTQALALVVDDPDAPGGTYTHWVVLDIATYVKSTPEGAIPEAGIEIENSSGSPSYSGPCPPDGSHDYRFTVYALSEPTGLDGNASLDDALRAIEAGAISWGRLTAVYERP